MDKQIGQRLREMRLKAKLSQAKVAAVVGSRQSAVARFESGEAHVPADVMVGYADYFDMSLDYIFGRTDNLHGTHYEGKVKIEKAWVVFLFEYTIGLLASAASGDYRFLASISRRNGLSMIRRLRL